MGGCRSAAATLIRMELVLYLPLCLHFCVCGLVLQTSVVLSSLRGAPVAEFCDPDNFTLSQVKHHLNTFAAAAVARFRLRPCGPSHLAADGKF